MAKAKAAKTSGRKVIPPRVEHCNQGHVMFTFLLVPVHGRKRFLRSCECEIKPMVASR